MNSIYTAEQVKAFEENSFIKEGDDLQAMIEAAKQSVEVLNKDYPTSEFLILCGPGNNGGDGYFIGIGLSQVKKTCQIFRCTKTCKEISPMRACI